MTKSEIKIGGRYKALVNRNLVTVKVLAIRAKGYGTSYDVVNETTGRHTTFRSAMKFRSEVPAPLFAEGTPERNLIEKASATKTVLTFPGDHDLPMTTEDEQCSDPTTVIAPAQSQSALQHTSPAIAESVGGLSPKTFDPSQTDCGGRAVSQLATRLAAQLRHEPSTPAPKSGLQPTQEQAEIMELARQIQASTGGVMMIEAGAGTGKTSTFRMLADVLTGNGQYTAFNRALVDESAAKFRGTRVDCKTTHQLAFRAIGRQFAERLDGKRVRGHQLAKLMGLETLRLDVGGSDHYLAPGWLASHVMGAVRKFCQSADKEITAGHFKYVDGIDLPGENGRTFDNNQKVRDHLLPYARKAWQDLNSEEGKLPFSHDHYVKIWELTGPVIAGSYILVDESQDLSPVMLSIIEQQLQGDNPPTVLLVGDSAQQIYEWRGAVNALAAFPSAPRKMLSQSFRFGEAIANVANRVLETLEESTPLRLKGLPSIPSRIEEVEKPTAILTRTNALAVANLLTAVGNGVRAALVGKIDDIISFMEAARDLQQSKPTQHPDLGCFENWASVQAYVKEDEGEDLKLLVKLIDSFGVDTILAALHTMPPERDAELVISTAHKSKGREWDSVQLAADFPTQSKCSDSDRKLLYVAVTRAKLVLDISRCPFFTGEDSLDVSDVIAGQVREPKSILPAAPSVPPAPTQFTWQKAQDEKAWYVRGPRDQTGQEVDVYRRDGSKQRKRLLQVVEDLGPVCTYKVR